MKYLDYYQCVSMVFERFSFSKFGNKKKTLTMAKKTDNSPLKLIIVVNDYKNINE